MVATLPRTGPPPKQVRRTSLDEIRLVGDGDSTRKVLQEIIAEVKEHGKEIWK